MFPRAAAGWRLLALALFVRVAIPASAQDRVYTFSTLAGGGIEGSADGFGRAAQFHAVGGIAVNRDGGVFVADSVRHTIRLISPWREVTTIAGSPGESGRANGTGSSARFNMPLGLAVDSNGDLYVADSLNHVIRKVTRNGDVSIFAGYGNPGGFNGTGREAYFNEPSAVAIDSSGFVYVGELCAVRKVSPSGEVSTLAGVTGRDGYLDAVGGLARFSQIRGIAVDQGGFVYVADSGNQVIRRIAPDGTVTTLSGTVYRSGSTDGPVASALFHGPAGLALDSEGSLFVADSVNRTIRRIGMDGFVTTVGGKAGGFGDRDGTGQDARFTHPTVVAVDAVGELYVSGMTIRSSLPPLFASHPASKTGIVGSLVSFSAESNRPALAYQWLKDGVPVTGATSPTLVIQRVSEADEGTYALRVVLGDGVTVSDPAVLQISASRYVVPYAFTTAWGIAGNPGTRGGTAAKLRRPYGIVRLPDGDYVISDSESHTIRRVTAAGAVTTIAGAPGEAGATDGPGPTARFNIPRDLARDAAGNIYVSDWGNSTIRRITPDGVVSTFAGQAGVPGSSNGVGTGATLRPNGMVFGRAGELYVAEAGNNVIRRIGADGVVTTFAGKVGESSTINGARLEARFRTPVGIAIDSVGSLYITDEANRNVRKIDAGGRVTTLAGPNDGRLFGPGSNDGTGEAARFWAPWAIVVDSSGDVIVSDQGDRRLRRISPTGVVTTMSPRSAHEYTGYGDGPPSEAQLGSLLAIAAEPDGSVVITDGQWHTLRRVEPDGAIETFAGHVGHPGDDDASEPAVLLHRPAGIAFDGTGGLYVAEPASAMIRRISARGLSERVAGQPMQTAGVDFSYFGSFLLNAPYGVAVGTGGQVVFAEASSHVIRTVGTDGAMSILAGRLGVGTRVDGTGGAALFKMPLDVVCDRDGNIYVADTDNSVVRKVTPAGVVTTLHPPGDDGSPYLFRHAIGVGIDAVGRVFVAAAGSHTIWRVNTDGSRTLVGGRDYKSGHIDGPVESALFNQPRDVAVDAAGNLFVVDEGNGLIRRIGIDGMVTTVGGLIGVQGGADGDGPRATFTEPASILVDAAGVLYVSDSGTHTIRRGVPAPAISKDPMATTLKGGDAATLQVVATAAGPLRYQWLRNGDEIVGATQPSFTLPSVQAFHGGDYTCRVTVGDISVLSNPGTLTVEPPPASDSRVMNLSTRALDLTGDKLLIPGFVISGSGTKKLLIRGVGPTLGSFGVGGTLEDPVMRVVRGSSEVAANDNWGSNANVAEIATVATQVGAFGLQDGSKDAALLLDLPAGEYTVPTWGRAEGTGVAMVELYDADETPTARLVNISNRGFVGTGDNLMIPGLVVSNEGSRTFLIRAVGPTLAAFNVSGTLEDPVLTVFSNGTPILSNDDWGVGADAAQTAAVAVQVGAFALADGSQDAAFVVTLPPGPYTVQVVGKNDTTGVALVEIYLVP